MIRNILGAAFAGAAIVIAGPALAAPGGGGGGPGANVGANVHLNMPAGGPSQTGIDARVNSQGSLNASPKAMENASPNSALNVNSTTNTTTRATNSQGAANASIKAIERASPNSVLARGSVQASVLPGLTTGLTVKGNGGATIGTVSRVVTGTDGSIRLVLVTNTSGKTMRLMPNTLTINGGIVTTTSM